ncbi:hypothetical protein ACS2QL_28340 [Bacillus cereus group sp. Bce038]
MESTFLPVNFRKVLMIRLEFLVVGDTLSKLHNRLTVERVTPLFEDNSSGSGAKTFTYLQVIS